MLLQYTPAAMMIIFTKQARGWEGRQFLKITPWRVDDRRMVVVLKTPLVFHKIAAPSHPLAYLVKIIIIAAGVY